MKGEKEELDTFFFFSNEGQAEGYGSITFNDQNLNSGSTSIAQANFARRDLLNICKNSKQLTCCIKLRQHVLAQLHGLRRFVSNKKKCIVISKTILSKN